MGGAFRLGRLKQEVKGAAYIGSGVAMTIAGARHASSNESSSFQEGRWNGSFHLCRPVLRSGSCYPGLRRFRGWLESFRRLAGRPRSGSPHHAVLHESQFIVALEVHRELRGRAHPVCQVKRGICQDSPMPTDDFSQPIREITQSRQRWFVRRKCISRIGRDDHDPHFQPLLQWSERGAHSWQHHHP